MIVKLITHTPEPEKVIAGAAKLCYSSSDIESLMNGLTTEKVEVFIKKLTDLGHQSPLEHCTFTFGIEGVSRALSHQLVRHRIASYSQKSQRYVKEGQFEYIVPPTIAENKIDKSIYEDFMKHILEKKIEETEEKLKEKGENFNPHAFSNFWNGVSNGWDN